MMRISMYQIAEVVQTKSQNLKRYVNYAGLNPILVEVYFWELQYQPCPVRSTPYEEDIISQRS